MPTNDELLALAAQAIEARSGETRQRLDPKDESAVAESDAPNLDPDTPQTSGGHDG